MFFFFAHPSLMWHHEGRKSVDHRGGHEGRECSGAAHSPRGRGRPGGLAGGARCLNTPAQGRWRGGKFGHFRGALAGPRGLRQLRRRCSGTASSLSSDPSPQRPGSRPCAGGASSSECALGVSASYPPTPICGAALALPAAGRLAVGSAGRDQGASPPAEAQPVESACSLHSGRARGGL